MATCKRFTFVVAGSGAFPVDMLRYDQCWPTSTDGALELKRTPLDGTAKDPAYFSTREVRMASHSEPTEARWQSFGWRVAEVQGSRL